MTPEGKVKADVKRLLDKYPHYRFMPVQTGMGTITLDFLVCINGHFLAIETKAPGKLPTAQQENCMEKITKAGGVVLVVDGDESLSELKNIIERRLLKCST